MICFDELTSAPKQIQSASYKILLDRKVGQKKLHDKVVMLALGNKASDNAVVYEMSTALQSRMVHLELELSHKEWIDWAIKNNIDSRIIGYMEFQPENLMTFKADHSDHTYACPRTWEFTNRLIQGKDVTLDDLPLLAGVISPGVAHSFIAFTTVYSQLPKLSVILSDPENAPLPDEPSMKYAMASYLAEQINATNVDKLVVYIARLPIEIQVVCLRMINLRKNSLISHKEIQKLFVNLMRYF